MGGEVLAVPSWGELSGGGRGRGKPPRANQNKIVKNMLEVKAEKAKIAQDKLARVKEKISVTPRKQPHREAAAADADEESEGKLVHSDSEDFQSESDISIGSSESYDYDKEFKSMMPYCTDSEFQDGLSGVDKEEFNEKHKTKKNLFWLNQGTHKFLYYKDINQMIGIHKNVKL